MKHLNSCVCFVFGQLFFLQNLLLSIIFLTLGTNSLASELEECVFTLKEMNQYFADGGFKNPDAYRKEWLSYNTGQYFVLDKTRGKIYSYFVDEDRINALDSNGKASVTYMPFKLHASQNGAMIVDSNSGEWGSFFFYKGKIISNKIGEIAPLLNEIFPRPDVNNRYLIRRYSDQGKEKFQIVTTDDFSVKLVSDIPSSDSSISDFTIAYVESTNSELYILMRQSFKAPSFKVLVYSTKTWELLRAHTVELPKEMRENSSIDLIQLDIDHKNIIAVRLVDGFFSTNTLLKLSFVSNNVTEFKLRRGGMGGYIYFKMAPGGCKKNYLNTKDSVTIEQ